MLDDVFPSAVTHQIPRTTDCTLSPLEAEQFELTKTWWKPELERIASLSGTL